MALTLEEKTQKIYLKMLDYAYYKPRSHKEIQQKLATLLKRVHEDDRVAVEAAVMSQLEEDALLGDAKAIQTYIDSFMISHKPRSRREIRQYLFNKRFDSREIDVAVADIPDEYERDCIQRLISKKRGTDPARLKRYLFSKGYNPDLVMDLIKTRF